MTISEAKISTKRQVTLPIKVMRELNVKPGDKLAFERHGNRIEITPSRGEFTIDDFIKKHSKTSKIKLSQKELNKARVEAWTHRYQGQ